MKTVVHASSAFNVSSALRRQDVPRLLGELRDSGTLRRLGIGSGMYRFSLQHAVEIPLHARLVCTQDHRSFHSKIINTGIY